MSDTTPEVSNTKKTVLIIIAGTVAITAIASIFIPEFRATALNLIKPLLGTIELLCK